MQKILTLFLPFLKDKNYKYPEFCNIKLDDPDIEDLLFSAQHEEVKQKLDIESKKNEFEYTKKFEGFLRNIAVEKSLTKQKAIELQMQEVEKQLLYNLANVLKNPVSNETLNSPTTKRKPKKPSD